jgi:transposase InsO family protein
MPVAAMCRELHVSESGFHRWRSRRGCPDRRLREDEAELLVLVRRLHRKHPGCGRPRLLALLKLAGHSIGANRLRRIMRETGVSGRCGRKPLRQDRDPQTTAPAARNILKRNFAVDAPNKVWSGDITEFHVGLGRLRLAVVIDLYSRRVVGWKLDARMKTSLVTAALKSAVRLRKPSRGLIFHSDQGAQYTSTRFREMLQVLGIRQSMSRRGNCWDNAPTESFFATLKKELFHGRTFRSCAELEAAIARYIKRYNNSRLHTTLGLRSPRDYELQHNA